MNIKIGNPVKKEYRNCYVLSHEYMIGDADGTDEFFNVISKENPFLIPYLEYLHSLEDEVSEEDNDEFICTLNKTVENYSKFLNEIDFEVRTFGDLGHYYYCGYTITFFDEFGNEFEVEIIN